VRYWVSRAACRSDLPRERFSPLALTGLASRGNRCRLIEGKADSTATSSVLRCVNQLLAVRLEGANHQ